MLRKRQKKICKALCIKILCSLVKICRMCIEDLNIYKRHWDNTYTDFFHLSDYSIVNIKTQATLYKYILFRIQWYQRAYPFGANIYISKCYSAKSYFTKCCKEKIQNILGIALCVKLFCCISIVSQMICELLHTYYIIYTLTKIRNTFYLYHTCLHALWLNNILLRQYLGSGSRTDLENSTSDI